MFILKPLDVVDCRLSPFCVTCWKVLSFPKIGGDDVIEDYAKKAIRNLLHENIDVHSRRFIAEFPKDGVKCIENCNHIVQT